MCCAVTELTVRAQMHPSVRHLSLDGLCPADLDEWNDRLFGPQIVVTTCLAIDQ